jgi:hypothetical protein
MAGWGFFSPKQMGMSSPELGPGNDHNNSSLENHHSSFFLLLSSSDESEKKFRDGWLPA